MLSLEQQDLLNNLVNSLNSNQKIWVAGYFAGLTNSASDGANFLQGVESSATTESVSQNFTVLYGSRSGNSEMVAKQIADRFSAEGFVVKSADMNDYKTKDLKTEKNIIVVVSTHGEGVPPVAAEEFYQFVHSKRVPTLENINFAVCALGDTSYQFFCQTGADFDKRFEELGAKRIIDRVDCDVDFEDASDAWTEKLIQTVKLNSSQNILVKPMVKSAPVVAKSQYTKKNPFNALVLNKILLSGRGSAKENYHIELSLENSGLIYKPGDAIGVFPKNSSGLIDQLIKFKQFNPETIIENGVGTKSLRNILLNHYEVTVLTKDVMTKYSEHSGNADLLKIVEDTELLRKYIYGRDVLDLLTDFPSEIAPDHLISLLRKLQPRLYSISSSLSAYPDEVHLTVGAVRYNAKGRDKEGVCSTFLADRMNMDETIPVYIDSNPNFKLPENPEMPVIMVGPGTGIAPFRSFIQEREASGATGKNWLFFGDQHFTTDFLYQTELQKFHKNGIITKLDVAFSRDTDKKIYVQHKMLEKAREIYDWIQEGAYFYVCGDMEGMAPDVHHALVKIVEEQGNMRHDAAHDFVRELQKSRRYQEDVY